MKASSLVNGCSVSRTTKNERPRSAVNTRGRGNQLVEEGRMASVTTLVPSRTTYAICPVCGGPSASNVTRLVRGVWLADHMCSGGHLWMTKWVAVP